MRSPRLNLVLTAALLLPSAGFSENKKLTFDERVEIMRGLMAEYATVKQYLPRSKKPLPFAADGTYDKKKWADMGLELGPAARVGDLVQITKVDIESDRILLEINGGTKGKKHWYDHVQIGMGGSTTPVNTNQNQNSNAASGTNIVIEFGTPLTAMQASDIKKILAPILDFEKHSATQQYTDTLPPEVQKAIKENKAIEGMDREMVQLALGKPRAKTRETKDGVDYEDWIYGEPPGKITFVTFQGAKVSKIKEAYAGIGGSTAVTPPVPD